MRSNSKFRGQMPIVAGLIGIGAYQIFLRFQHPAVMEEDFFHGMWIGICLALEIIGLYQLTHRRRGSAN